VLLNKTSTATVNIFGVELADFVGGGMIIGSLLVFVIILVSRRVVLIEN
jgi:hypothetical protein